MDWLLTRETVIGLAILGAVPSAAASLLKPRLTERRVRQLDIAGYGLMGASMLLFVVIGFRS